MKIAIVGAGAIGGLLGARLSLAGEEVAFIARNRNLLGDRAARHSPDRGRRPRAACIARPRLRRRQRGRAAGRGAARRQGAPGAGSDAGDAGPARPRDRGGDDEQRPALVVLPAPAGRFRDQVLESVDPGGAIAAAIEPGRVIGSVVYPAAELVEPGRCALIEGNRFASASPTAGGARRIEALSEALMRAGFKAPITKDIRDEIWLKLWGNLASTRSAPSATPRSKASAAIPTAARVVEAMMGRRGRSRRSSGWCFGSRSTSGSPAPRRSARTRPRCSRTSSRAGRSSSSAGRQRRRARPDHRRPDAEHRGGPPRRRPALAHPGGARHRPGARRLSPRRGRRPAARPVAGTDIARVRPGYGLSAKSIA